MNGEVIRLFFWRLVFNIYNKITSNSEALQLWQAQCFHLSHKLIQLDLECNLILSGTLQAYTSCNNATKRHKIRPHTLPRLIRKLSKRMFVASSLSECMSDITSGFTFWLRGPAWSVAVPWPYWGQQSDQSLDGGQWQIPSQVPEREKHICELCIALVRVLWVKTKANDVL